MNKWDTPRNAGIYDQFARRHSMYRDSSRDLIDRAGISEAGLVVDLGCGSGVSTEAILGHSSRIASVIGIDGSAAMLQVAQTRVSDVRARWVKADGAEVAAHAIGADAIICNAAIWQMAMGSTIRACREALRSSGKFAFNIPRHSDMMRSVPGERRPAKPTLIHLIQALAVLEYNFVPPVPVLTRGTRKERVSVDLKGIRKLIIDAGLVLDVVEEAEYDNPAESQLAWLKVPVFAENILPGMPYPQQIRIIEAAFERFDKDSARKRAWFVFVAHKP